MLFVFLCFVWFGLAWFALLKLVCVSWVLFGLVSVRPVVVFGLVGEAEAEAAEAAGWFSLVPVCCTRRRFFLFSLVASRVAVLLCLGLGWVCLIRMSTLVCFLLSHSLVCMLAE